MKAAACSCRTSIRRMPSFAQEDSASSIGPPIRKKRSLTPSFLRHLARISEPVNSVIFAVSSVFCVPAIALSDHVVLMERVDVVRAHPEPFAQHVLVVFPQEWGR